MGVFPFFSLKLSLCLTLSIISLSLCLSLSFPSITHLFFSISHSAIFTAMKGLSKQNSWTNRPWDEFHGGSWQQQAEAKVPVSICTELSKSDIVIQIVKEWTC